MNHPTIDRLNARLEGTLSERERAEFDSHLSKCPACRHRLSEHASLVAGLRRLDAQAPSEAPGAVEPAASATITTPPAPQPSPRAGGLVATWSSPIVARVRRLPLWRRVFSGSGFSAAATASVFLLILGLVCTRIDSSVGPRAADEQPAEDEFIPDWQAPSPDVALADAPSADGTTILAVTGLRTSAAMPPAASAMLERDLSGMRPGLSKAMAGASASPPPAAAPQEQGTPLDLAAAVDSTAVSPAGPNPVAVLPVPNEKPAPPEAQASSEALPGVPAISRPSSLAPALATARQPVRVEAEIVPPCGTLSDPRGNPIVGAQVVALGSVARAARSGADGRFCFTTLRVGDTVSVWRAGFQPIRVTLDSETLLSLRMQPIPTPIPEATGR